MGVIGDLKGSNLYEQILSALLSKCIWLGQNHDWSRLKEKEMKEIGKSEYRQHFGGVLL